MSHAPKAAGSASLPARRWGRVPFSVIAGFNALVAIVLSVSLFASTRTVFEGLGIAYNPTLDPVGFITGGMFMVFGVLHVAAIVWTWQGKTEGIFLVSVYAVFLVALGVNDLMRTGQTGVLIFDGLRGVLTLGAGYLAYRERGR